MTKCKAFFIVIYSCLLIILSGCVDHQFVHENLKSGAERLGQSKPLQHASKGLDLLDQREYRQASKSFNTALRLNPRNSGLQFFNSHTYHLIAKREDSSLFALAEAGYRVSLSLDPTNWISKFYLGQLYLDQRKFFEAKRIFSELILLRPSDADVAYNLAVAGYYSGDPLTAAAAAFRLGELQPNDLRTQKLSAIVYASVNDTQQSKYWFAKMRENRGSEALKTRLEDWKGFYRYVKLRTPEKFLDRSNVSSNRDRAPLTLAQAFGPSPDGADTAESASGADEIGSSSEQEEEKSDSTEAEVKVKRLPNEKKMIIVDVVIISSVEDIKTASGINLLKNLQLTFGSADSAGLSYTRSISEDFKDPSSSTDTRAIVRALTIPAITYSLNIANSGTDRNDVLARPTIVAREGETSEFFSGENIKASSVSTTAQQGATEVEQDIGVSLKVKPELVSDQMVKLNLEVERTFLQTPSSSVTFNFQLRTTKTRVNATVDLRKGDTLILRGLSEKQTENLRDGVPFLQDVPGLQYFFSSKKTRDYNKSVILLITPRFPEYTYRPATPSGSSVNDKYATIEDGVGASGAEDRGDPKNREPRASPEVTELQARYTDWFKPYPNWASAFKHLQGNKLYREFRTGDVSLEKWEAQTTHKARLKKALDFLYF